MGIISFIDSLFQLLSGLVVVVLEVIPLKILGVISTITTILLFPIKLCLYSCKVVKEKYGNIKELGIRQVLSIVWDECVKNTNSFILEKMFPKKFLKLSTKSRKILMIADSSTIFKQFKCPANSRLTTMVELDRLKNELHYVIPANVNVGNILARHPFHKNEFVLYDDCENLLIEQKLEIISNIVSALGVVKGTTIEGKPVETISSNGDNNPNLINKFKKFWIENIGKVIPAFKKTGKSYTRTIDMQETRDIKKAKKIAKENGLYDDFRLLISEIRHNSHKQHYKTTLKLELSKEYHDLMDIVTALPKEICNKIDIIKQRNSAERIFINQEIEFGEQTISTPVAKNSWLSKLKTQLRK